MDSGATTGSPRFLLALDFDNTLISHSKETYLTAQTLFARDEEGKLIEGGETPKYVVGKELSDGMRH